MIRLPHVLVIMTLLSSSALPLSDAFADAAQNVGSLQDSKIHTREEFVGGMASMTLAILQDHKKPFPERKLVLRRAFNTVVDIDWIARFVLGRSWSTASDEQKQRYTDLYRTFLTESYVSNFAENPDKRIKDIKILGIQDDVDNGFRVSTNMLLADREEIRVDYRVSDHEDKYKVIDIIIENVSLLSTHRSQFAELAANRGIEGVISKLDGMNQSSDTASISVPMP